MKRLFRNNAKNISSGESLPAEKDLSAETDASAKKKDRFRAFIRKALPGVVLPVVLLVGLYILQSILVHYPSVGEWYSRNLFPVLSFIPMKLSALAPISITEVFVLTLAFSSPILIAWFVIRIVRAVKNKRGKKFFFNVIRIAAWSLFAIYAIFMLFHGLNFTRRSLDDSLGFNNRKYTVEELKEAYTWVVDELNAARRACPEDERGVVTYPGGVMAFLSDMEDLYEESAAKIPEITGNSVRPKPVMMSHYWSYTYIVGMYFPFFVESNINTDVELSEMFYTVCHEMSHLHGFAVENDANLAAMLIGFNSSCPQLRYCAFSEALDLIFMDLAIAYNDDSEGFEEFVVQHPIVAGYFQDQDARSEYWATINPPEIVTNVSDATNDTFLKVNQQEEGVKSYNMPTSTVADYYFTHVKSTV